MGRKTTAVEKPKEPEETRTDTGTMPPVNPLDTGREVALMLAARFSADYLERKLREMLNATETYVTKTGNEFTRPCWAPRMKALELLLAYQVGRPVERSQSIVVNEPPRREDLLEKAKRSPVFRASLVELIREVKEK